MRGFYRADAGALPRAQRCAGDRASEAAGRGLVGTGPRLLLAALLVLLSFVLSFAVEPVGEVFAWTTGARGFYEDKRAPKFTSPSHFLREISWTALFHLGGRGSG